MAAKNKPESARTPPMENAGIDTPPVKRRTSEPTKIDPATLPNLYPGVDGRRSYVVLLQRLLRCGETGVYDSTTAQAVQRFQLANDLPPEAGVTQAMWRKLIG